MGEKAIIVELCFPDAAQQYLMRLGFVPGVEVEVIRRTPLQGPVVYRLQGTDIAIRYETAAGIGVHVISTQGAELP